MSPHAAFSLSEGEPDFLGRLIDRSFDLKESIQPRVQSLFEPTPRVALAAEIAWQTEAPNSHAETSKSAPESRPRRLGLHGENARQTVRVAESNTQRPAAKAGVMGEREQASPRNIRRGPADNMQPMKPTNMVEAIGSLTDEQVATPKVSRAPAEVPALRADHAMPPPLWSRKEPAQVVRSGDEPRRAPSTRFENPIATAPPVATLIPQRAPLSAGAALVLPRPAGVEPPAAANDQTPIINVTIGRVDVRAVHSAVPTTRQRDPNAGPRPLSLDEYLKQRGAGR